VETADQALGEHSFAQGRTITTEQATALGRRLLRHPVESRFFQKSFLTDLDESSASNGPQAMTDLWRQRHRDVALSNPDRPSPADLEALEVDWRGMLEECYPEGGK
jgi:hypothetical protein